MIFVSAGHHPSAPGAKYDRFIEHDEACIWADKMAWKLGINSTLVPPGKLQSKVDYINSRVMKGDIAIEIHFNAFKLWDDLNGDGIATEDELTAAGRGCETLYYPGSESGKRIATLCQDALAQVFPPSRGVKEGWYKMNPKRGPDFFLARTKCPAVILEPEFVHHSDLIIENRDKAIGLIISKLTEKELNDDY